MAFRLENLDLQTAYCRHAPYALSAIKCCPWSVFRRAVFENHHRLILRLATGDGDKVDQCCIFSKRSARNNILFHVKSMSLDQRLFAATTFNSQQMSASPLASSSFLRRSADSMAAPISDRSWAMLVILHQAHFIHCSSMSPIAP
jgi:hypothetical protein